MKGSVNAQERRQLRVPLLKMPQQELAQLSKRLLCFRRTEHVAPEGLIALLIEAN